ncbi:unnamed protein product (macronuclear) [Paramecium tetraurelia]|uniref:Uncharacterized protein n=1 Tax=Paramecium tetraurelia TaxID=5888 RepID=A0BWV8_PARTE|nr:uncharacterized protein GSPATT00032877001 [Paramecium tetraurelia]CAK63025.1 unnamed protein product [Paramecium tetraurelia]|eukprot:XP_001430423.1 hypothetical protein (macronuclear) [Paramecium tetraurelia strain d4-2]
MIIEPFLGIQQQGNLKRVLKFSKKGQRQNKSINYFETIRFQNYVGIQGHNKPTIWFNSLIRILQMNNQLDNEQIREKKNIQNQSCLVRKE